MSSERILAIDDEPEVLHIVSRCLEEYGYEVLQAVDGEEGLEAIQCERPDLIISDILMPKIDGFELIQMLRADPLIGATPFIILSGRGEAADQIRALDLGADDYITKPFDFSVLVARVRALLRRSEALKKRTSPAPEGPFASEGLEQLAGYRFENFVLGTGNHLAYEAAKGVAEKPGSRFNPLFLYGEPGRGKTHLMCALGNDVHEKDGSIKVLYLTSQLFSDQILEAYENRRVQELRQAYLESDLLIIDDIQFLAISPSLQSVAAGLLAEMYDQDKQIVISSDRRPEELQTITSEIIEGFALGVVVKMDRPDATLRSMILRTKAKQNNWPVEDLLLDYLANKIESDVRTIEGIAKKLVALKTLRGVSLNKELVDDLVKEVAELESQEVVRVEGRGVSSETSGVVHELHDEGFEVVQETEKVTGLIEECSIEPKPARVWGLPEEVAAEIPSTGAEIVVVLGTSGALVTDVIDALGGTRKEVALIPEGKRWAYMVLSERTGGEWILLGSNCWGEGCSLSAAIQGNKSPVFLIVLDSRTLKIQNARALISTAGEQNRMAVITVGTIVDTYASKRDMTILLTSTRRLFRVPPQVPILLSSAVNDDECRRWLKAALGSEFGGEK